MTKYAHAIFCDDARQEISGKTTLVGIYQGQCLVPQFPCTLPKLCINLSISAPRSEMPKSVSVKGTFAGEEVMSMSLDNAQIDSIINANPSPRPERKRMMLGLMAIMSPFNLKEPGRLALHVMVDGEDLPCDSLDIDVAPPGTVFGF